MAKSKIHPKSKLDPLGQPRGVDYKPHLRVRDVPSKGRSSRERSWTNGRVIHCLSDVEWSFFLIAEWDDLVIDIREQYPLPLEKPSLLLNN